MRECWINIYKRNDFVWRGDCHKDRWKAEAVSNKYIIYRIHVVLK